MRWRLHVVQLNGREAGGGGVHILGRRYGYLANFDVVLTVRHIALLLEKSLEMEEKKNVLRWGSGGTFSR